MKEGRASLTAQSVAIKRAVHQIVDNPKVFDDSMALRIIGKECASRLQNDPHQYDTSRLAPYVRAFTAARSRYAEDELALGIQRGVRQYVVLGAGLDTFAYRNPYPESVLRVFEVDHPATQVWKRARLEEVGITLHRDLTFAPIDFETQTLTEGLSVAGYDSDKSTFFSWLGVTEYLPTEAVMATLRFVASAPKGSGIVFDYMISPSLLNPDQKKRFDYLAQRVASAGEPWQTFFEPEALTKDLQAMGFRFVKDNGQAEINQRYFRDRADGLQVGSLSHIMVAWV
jgi:methyltransferase (TIGR00027 family)